MEFVSINTVGILFRVWTDPRKVCYLQCQKIGGFCSYKVEKLAWKVWKKK